MKIGIVECMKFFWFRGLPTSLKEDAERLFDDLGLTMTEAITLFLKQAVREQAIPFTVGKDLSGASEFGNKKRFDSFSAILEE